MTMTTIIVAVLAFAAGWLMRTRPPDDATKALLTDLRPRLQSGGIDSEEVEKILGRLATAWAVRPPWHKFTPIVADNLAPALIDSYRRYGPGKG
jgi:hypothetical protein